MTTETKYKTLQDKSFQIHSSRMQRAVQLRYFRANTDSQAVFLMMRGNPRVYGGGG